MYHQKAEAQEHDAHDERGDETEAATEVFLILGEPVGGYRYENKIIDSEHEFEENKRQQTQPAIGGQKRFKKLQF
jgi:hypothetical protein